MAAFSIQKRSELRCGFYLVHFIKLKDNGVNLRLNMPDAICSAEPRRE